MVRFSSCARGDSLWRVGELAVSGGSLMWAEELKPSQSPVFSLRQSPPVSIPWEWLFPLSACRYTFACPFPWPHLLPQGSRLVYHVVIYLSTQNFPCPKERFEGNGDSRRLSPSLPDLRGGASFQWVLRAILQRDTVASSSVIFLVGRF